MILTTLPSASAINAGSLGSCLMRSHSRYPRGLSVSALRSPSERIDSPPAASICIMREVPERGKPETIVIISAFEEIDGHRMAPPHHRGHADFPANRDIRNLARAAPWQPFVNSDVRTG